MPIGALTIGSTTQITLLWSLKCVSYAFPFGSLKCKQQKTFCRSLRPVVFIYVLFVHLQRKIPERRSLAKKNAIFSNIGRYRKDKKKIRNSLSCRFRSFIFVRMQNQTKTFGQQKRWIALHWNRLCDVCSVLSELFHNTHVYGYGVNKLILPFQ